MESLFDFVVAAWVAVLILGMLEALGFMLFWPVSYTTGILVLRHIDAALPRPIAPLDSVLETKKGKYKFVSTERVFVRERTRFLGRRTEVRGSITWGPGGATVEARMPFMSALALVAAAAVMIGIVVQAGSLESLFIGVIFLGIIALNVYMSRRQMLVLLEEYREWSSQPEAARLTSASS